ncbi:SDR family oxidoreductase [Rhodococcus opacus]|nr:SDR family oxidoreductase [Rhodococcus opacus]
MTLGADWLDLKDRVAVVTGAGGGIGAAVASELARNGVRIAALDINEDGALTTAEHLKKAGTDAIGLRVDIADESSVREAAETVAARYGPADILINNAGVMRSGDLSELSLSDWQFVLDVNLTGYLLCARTFGEAMRESGRGSIVHVSSISAAHPQASSGAYSPSKAAVSMLSRTLAFEWGPFGVRSNVVAPGMTRTPLTESFYEQPGVLEARAAVVPLRRVGAPQDLADVCTWLASDRSAYVTGQEIAVDGGFTQTLMSHVPRPGY